MSFSTDERLALCDELGHRGPTAPTLCEGWTTHDLTAHLWVREADPLAFPGMFVSALGGLTDRRMRRVRMRWTYCELVEKVRRGPAKWSAFALPGADAAANATEYFVHLEDVRRANGDTSSRDLGAESEALLWKRLRPLARLSFRSAPVGVRLEADTGESLAAASGSQIVTVVGKPSELLLFAFGRGTAAHVDFHGEVDAVAQVHALKLGL